MIKNISFILLLLTLIVGILTTSKYEVVNAENSTSSLTLTLKYTGQDDYYLKPTSPIVKNLKLTIKTLSYTDFDLKIVDADK